MIGRSQVIRALIICAVLAAFCGSLYAETAPGATDDGRRMTDDEIVYLKAEKAFASGFDATPDWAPKPNPMAPFDGDPETRWSSAYKDGEWLYLDFGKPKTMSKIIMRWEAAYASSYEILVSDDATNWKRLILLDEQTGGTREINFQPVACRFVKLLGLARANPEWGISIWEFEAYGPKDKNAGDVPYEEAFKVTGAAAGMENKKSEMKFMSGQIVPSPGAVSIYEFQRGINYTSWDRDELGGNASDYSLIYISQLGVGHIGLMAVHYQPGVEAGKIYRDEKKTVSDESLAHAINIIHSLGMKVMLKPHVDLSDGEMRTNILPSDEWFDSYKEFILHYAGVAEKYNVELFCIGTELSNTVTSRWNDKWLDIIREVRKRYQGKITYAANWDEYEIVSFWEDVDFIGIDAYFPLTDKKNPPLEELVAAWESRADALEKWLSAAKLKKPVIFTEIGYDTIEGSNKHPWRVLPTLAKYVESQEEQANCLQSLLTVLSKRSWFKGLYWWNYFPRPDIGPLGYTLRGKQGEKVLSGWYKKLK